METMNIINPWTRLNPNDACRCPTIHHASDTRIVASRATLSDATPRPRDVGLERSVHSVPGSVIRR
jgi:hypothetical protein